MSSAGSGPRNAAQRRNQRTQNVSNVSRAAVRVSGKASAKAPAARSNVSKRSLPKDNRTTIEHAILGPGTLSDSEADREGSRNGYSGLDNGNEERSLVLNGSHHLDIDPPNSSRFTPQIVQPEDDVPVDWQLQAEDLRRSLDTQESECYRLKQSTVDLQQQVIKTKADSEAARQASLFALIFLSLIPRRH
jgi:hypothetical protein